jgi:hypothetical protein
MHRPGDRKRGEAGRSGSPDWVRDRKRGEAGRSGSPDWVRDRKRG